MIFVNKPYENLIEQNQEKFQLFYDMLIEWNNKFNLTAITDKNDVYTKHFLDSIIGEKYIVKDARVLDIGAGAGFPSLPLKIVREDLSFTLVDSLNKRVVFLNEVISKLNLTNTQAIHTRAEDIKEKNEYDCVVSRAVASLQVLVELCLPFVKVGGIMLAYKSSDIDDELINAEKAIKILGGDKPEIFVEELNSEVKRKFVVIKKIANTDKKYPRGKNLPRTNPL